MSSEGCQQDFSLIRDQELACRERRPLNYKALSFLLRVSVLSSPPPSRGQGSHLRYQPSCRR